MTLVALGFGALALVVIDCRDDEHDARDFYAKGEWDKAISSDTEVIRRNPKDASAYLARGCAHEAKGELDEAISDYTEAIRLNPKDAIAYANRGHAYSKKQEWDNALVDENHAIRLDPNLSAAWAYRGDVSALKSNFDQAITDYNQAIQLDPKSWAFGNRGFAYAKQGQHDKAISDYSQAILLNPNDAITIYNRGCAYRKKGEFDKAILDHQEAVRLAPKNAELNDGLGWLLATCPAASIRNGKAAVEAARKANELADWKNSQFLSTMAAAEAESGNFDQAIKYQNQSLLLEGVTDESRVEAQQRLKLYEQRKPYHESPK